MPIHEFTTLSNIQSVIQEINGIAKSMAQAITLNDDSGEEYLHTDLEHLNRGNLAHIIK